MLNLARRILAVRAARRPPDRARQLEPLLTRPAEMLATAVGCSLGIAIVTAVGGLLDALPPPEAKTCLTMRTPGGTYELHNAHADARDIVFYCLAVPICATGNAHWVALGVVTASAWAHYCADDSK